MRVWHVTRRSRFPDCSPTAILPNELFCQSDGNRAGSAGNFEEGPRFVRNKTTVRTKSSPSGHLLSGHNTLPTRQAAYLLPIISHLNGLTFRILTRHQISNPAVAPADVPAGIGFSLFHRPYRFRIVFEATDGARREVRRCWEVKLRLLSPDALDGPHPGRLSV